MNRTIATGLIACVLLLGACGPAPAMNRDGGASAQRGGGARQPMAAQQSGSTARGAQGSAASQGTDSNGVACESALEGAGVCANETQVLFCAGGTWWLLDCAQLASGGFCGYDSATLAVDCYTAQ